jgi:iron complex outermembrane receptor protein
MRVRILLFSLGLSLTKLFSAATNPHRVLRRVSKLAWIALLGFPGFIAYSEQPPDLTQKSLADLMNIEVTSVSKREQKTSQTAAAVFVISREDIDRSGAQNIPDLLRMVPGLDVAQIDASKWAISARGFNGQYSNKLLVLIDGRAVYSPIFAGVFWDSENVPLDTIERIEVIRGPGAAAWGSNAVNGVINVITLNAKDSQGGNVAAGAGNDTIGPMTIRYGAKARGIGAYRVFAEGFHVSTQPTFAGLDGRDDARLIHGGFRTDTNLSAKDSLTTEGEIYQGNSGELSFIPLSLMPPESAIVALRDRYSGGNLLAKWNHAFSPASTTSLQFYFDRTSRGDTTYSIGRNTFDIDFQHHLVWGARQDIVWGLGYRVSMDDIDPTLRISATPQSRRTQLFNSFVQDEIAIVPDRIHLSLGARVEHNDYTGFNFQPSVRLVLTPDARNSIWAGVSLADRIPARSDTDFRVNFEALPGPGNVPILVSLFGNPNQRNEKLTAFETGYRTALTGRLSLDSTVFYNRYRDLTSVQPEASRIEANPPPIHLLIPESFGNSIFGETHGVEVFANWKVARVWTLNPGYSFLAIHLHEFANSQDGSIPGTQGGTPDHQAQLRSSVSLPWHLQWNASAYFVNRLPGLSIPSYTRIDTGLNWRLGESLSLSLAGQNLTKNLHPEYSGPNSTVQPGLMRRAAYAKISWSF